MSIQVNGKQLEVLKRAVMRSCQISPKVKKAIVYLFEQSDYLTKNVMVVVDKETFHSLSSAITELTSTRTGNNIDLLLEIVESTKTLKDFRGSIEEGGEFKEWNGSFSVVLGEKQDPLNGIDKIIKFSEVQQQIDDIPLMRELNG